MPLGRDKFSGFIEIYWNLLKSIEIYWNILKYIEIYWNLLDLDSLDFQFPTAFWISDSTDSKFRGLLLPMPAKKATSKDAGAVDWFLPWKVGFASNVTNTWEKKQWPTPPFYNGVDSPTATNHCLSFTLSRRWSILRSCSWKQEMCSMSLCVSIKYNKMYSNITPPIFHA